jgi:hypothetical protein
MACMTFHFVGRCLSSALVLVLLEAPPLRAFTCEAGSVTVDARTGMINVSYDSEDHDGNPIVRNVVVMPRTLFTPSVHESHVYDSATQSYEYTYRISNATGSVQQIWYVNFNISPSNVPTTNQASAGGGGWDFYSRDANCGGIAWSYIPSDARWRADPGRRGLKQGESMTFAFASALAPGPMVIYLEGDADSPVFPDEVPDCVGDLLDEVREACPAGYVKLVTIGPVPAGQAH